LLASTHEDGDEDKAGCEDVLRPAHHVELETHPWQAVDTQGGGCDAAAALAARGQSAVKDTREVDNGRTDHAVKKRWANLERSSGERRAAAIMRF